MAGRLLFSAAEDVERHRHPHPALRADLSRRRARCTGDASELLWGESDLDLLQLRDLRTHRLLVGTRSNRDSR
jgi:hypothetical protein